MEEKQCISAAIALSFFEKNGSSIWSNITERKNNDQIPSSVLSKPPETKVNNVLQIAKRFNSNTDVVKNIIENIFKCCVFFNVSDSCQIAYIFATICNETYFGSHNIEETGYLLGRYEPVFSDKQAIDQHKPFLKEEARYNQLKRDELKLIDKIELLYKDLNNNKLSIHDVNKLNIDANNALSNIDDALLSTYLTSIESADLEDIVSKFVTKKDKNNNEINKLLRFKFDENEKHPKVQNILDNLRKIAVPKPESQLVFQFYILQLKVLLIDWILTRIYTSSNVHNSCQGDGEKYKGRGLVQLTGRDNYTRFSEFFKNHQSPYYKAFNSLIDTRLSDSGQSSDNVCLINPATIIADGNDLVGSPEIASVVAVGGMAKGNFTGRKLSDYSTQSLSSKSEGIFSSGNTFNFFNARAIISPDKNLKEGKSGIKRGEKIENIAIEFLTALKT